MHREEGYLFEKELAEEFGLMQVPGSGSVWHSKLDLKGFKFRWSLKSTTKERWPISITDIIEALHSCMGPGGDGSSPIWAARTIVGDFIILRKEDFKALHTGELNLIQEDRPQVAARKARASTPALLRDEE